MKNNVVIAGYVKIGYEELKAFIAQIDRR